MVFCLSNTFIVDLVGDELLTVFNGIAIALILFSGAEIMMGYQTYSAKRKQQKIQIQQDYMIALKESHLPEPVKLARKARRKQIDKILSE